MATQVAIDATEGLKHPSWIKCDNLISIPKSHLINFVGSLSKLKLEELDNALRFALALY